MEVISVEMLRSLLSYDPETGQLTWKERDGWDGWNARYAGRSALIQSKRGGYLCGKIKNVDFRAHRIAFAMHYGRWPFNEVDHINGVVTDNRATNLREVTPSQNCRNQRRPANNTSGILGVWLDIRSGRWRAEARHDGINHKLGSFDTKEKAAMARAQASERFGYHPNHGRAGSNV